MHNITKIEIQLRDTIDIAVPEQKIVVTYYEENDLFSTTPMESIFLVEELNEDHRNRMVITEVYSMINRLVNVDDHIH